MGCIELPLRMASAVNYLMTLQLTAGFGAFVFFKLKMKKKKKAISMRLCLTVFQACGISFPAQSPGKKKKGMSIMELKRRRAFQEALM